MQLPENLLCVDLHRWTNCRFHRRFAHFGSFFFLITLIYNVCLAHIPAATSRHDLTDWTLQAAVDTKNCMRPAPDSLPTLYAGVD
jgi:hypothetical protein